MSAELMLVRAFAAAHPDEVARFIERLALEVENAAEVLASTVPLIAATTLTRLDTETAAQILEASHPSLAAGLLFRMERATRSRLLEAVSTERAEDLRRMTEYGPRRAGGRL